MSSWNDPQLTRLFLDATPLIDVRAPVEFNDGALPNSTNLPIMSDDERARVGTCYKEQGQAAAMALGHELVGGGVKQARIKAWQEHINAHPGAQVFCFRGGLRSQISCQWLREAGIDRRPIEGGYKRMRKFFLSWLDESPLPSMYRIGGLTGSGKTPFLKRLKNSIDIEGLASHRGSAFGGHSVQPAQITFENALAFELLKLKDQGPIAVEDESITLGKISIPARFFQAMRSSPLVVLKVSHEQRVLNIFNDYVKDSNAEFFQKGVDRIQKRISKSMYVELKEEIQRAFEAGLAVKEHEAWISLLLEQYYDPLYEKDIRRNESLIAFEGNEDEVLEFLTSRR